MYHYAECGLPNVWLVNGYEVRDTPYGEAVSIESMDGLHRAIGLALAQKPNDLTGEEVRFLREQMDTSQRMLGECLGIEEITIRKWETEKKTKPIKGPGPRLLRALYWEYALGDTRLRELIDKVNQTDHYEHEQRLSFKETPDGWRWQSLAA